METHQVDLSVIIVNWNTRKLLARCLESLFDGVQVSANLKVETYVVDNASTDGSAQMIAKCFPWVQLIQNADNVGFARANNQAIRQSKGRYVLLLNSDTILNPNNLVELLRFADTRPHAGIVGVKLVNPDGTFQAAQNDFPTFGSTLMEPWGIIQLLTRNAYYPSYPPDQAMHPAQCDWVGGACLLVRQAAIDQVGLLDERFFMNSEEVDWCYRMWEKAWEVWYTPDVEVIHLGGGSADRPSAVQRMRLYESKVRFLQKYYGPAAANIVRLNYRISSLTKALGYQLRFLVSRDKANLNHSQAHWQVAISRSWC